MGTVQKPTVLTHFLLSAFLAPSKKHSNCRRLKLERVWSYAVLPESRHRNQDCKTVDDRELLEFL